MVAQGVAVYWYFENKNYPVLPYLSWQMAFEVPILYGLGLVSTQSVPLVLKQPIPTRKNKKNTKSALDDDNGAAVANDKK